MYLNSFHYRDAAGLCDSRELVYYGEQVPYAGADPEIRPTKRDCDPSF